MLPRVRPEAGGETSRRIRDLDWSATPLGPIELWPNAVRNAFEMILRCSFPAALMVGDQRILLYNDAFAARSGPEQALGEPAHPDCCDGHFSISPVVDEHGRAVADLALGHDRTLIESMDHGYVLAEVLFDEQGVPVDLLHHDTNAAAVRMAGAELRGRRYSEIWQACDSALCEVAGRVLQTGIAEKHELLAPPMGRWFQVNAVRAGLRGRPMVALIIQDITERKTREAELRETQESLSIAIEAGGMGVWDLDLVREVSSHRNLRHDQMFGYATPQTEWGVAIARKHVVEDDLERFDASLEFAKQSGQLDLEFGVRWPDGSLHRIAVLGRVYFDERGNPVRAVGVSQEVTAQRKAEQILRERDARQALLLELSDRISPLTDAEKIQTEAAEILGRHLHVSRALYFEIDGDQLRIRSHYAEGAGSFVGAHPVERLGRGILEAFARGDAVVVEDVQHHPLLSPGARTTYAAAGVTAFIGLPLIREGHCVAGFAVVQNAPRRWMVTEVDLVREVAERTWAAVGRATALQALQESEERQAFLVRLGDALRSVADPLETQAIAARLLGQALDCAHCCYVEYDDSTSVATVSRDYARRDGTALVGQHAMADFPNLVKGHRAGLTLMVADVHEAPLVTPGAREFAHQLGVRSGIAVPVMKGDHPIASVLVLDDKPRQWTRLEVSLVEETAERTWAAVESARAQAALRESEERFRLLVENVREYALFQTDTEGKITSWNRGAERLFGYSSQEMLGEYTFRLLIPEDHEAHRREREARRLNGTRHREDARWLVRRDGSRFWARWVTESVYDNTGNLRGVVKILRDETERRNAEEQIRESLADKEALLKEVHHRVKNNLQVISSLVSLQAHRVKDPAALAALEETRNRVHSIATIHELVYRSTSLASIDMAEYATRLVGELCELHAIGDRVTTRINGTGLSLELERALPLGLLISELVSNVCKHAFPGDGTGALDVTLAVEEGLVTLEVKDDGAGMALGVDHRSSTTLGLGLIHRLAHQLRGKVEFTSPPGTRVAVRFPLSPEERTPA